MLQSPAARELADADAFSLKANPAMREVVAVAQVCMHYCSLAEHGGL